MPAGGFRITIDTPNALFVFDKKGLRKTMRWAGQEVSATAKGLIRGSAGGPGAPPKSRTGALIRSIKVSAYKSGLGVRVTAMAMAARGNGPYGLFLEAGVQYQTSPYKRPKRVHRKRDGTVAPAKGQTTIMPHPFLSTALAQRAASIDSRIKASVQDGVAFQKVK